LLTKYREEIAPKLQAEFGLSNRMAVARLEKIVVNMGLGQALGEPDRIPAAVQDLSVITGQRPVVTKARRSVAGFKLREGNPIGCKVTLRGTRLYEFLDRLINVAIPRIRDFRGLSPDAFDGQGNYTLGLTEQIVFPEISLDDVQYTQGMHITLVITGGSVERARRLLEELGMPFRKVETG